MFELFTPRARRVVVRAQEEARSLHHNWIGTEHLLLGLLLEPEGVASQSLALSGVTHTAARRMLEQAIGPGKDAPADYIPFTPRAKDCLGLALREAQALSHGYIGSEHLLLGLIREGHGAATVVLERLGVDPGRLRQDTLRLVPAQQSRSPDDPLSAGAPPPKDADTTSALDVTRPPTADRSSNVQKVIEAARDRAFALDHPTVGTEHLLLAMLADRKSAFSVSLRRRGLTFEAARTFISGMTTASATRIPALSPELEHWLETQAAHPPDSDAANTQRRAAEAVAASTSATTMALLASYNLTPEDICAATKEQPRATLKNVGKNVPFPGPARSTIELPDQFSGASSAARKLLSDAFTRGLTIDGFAHHILTAAGSHSRAALALRALDADPTAIAYHIAANSPGLSAANSAAATSNRLIPALGGTDKWLSRTGDQHPDTIHLLLCLLDNAPESAAYHAFEWFGVTLNLLTGVAVSSQDEVDLVDRPGTMSTAQNSPRGPAPSPLTHPTATLRPLAGSRLRRRLFRGESPTGDNLNSDLQFGRIRRLGKALYIRSIAQVAYLLTVVQQALVSGNWWLLLALVALVQPEAIPVPIWLMSAGLSMWFVPWPARIALLLFVVTAGLQLWLALQWRRSDSANTALTLKQMRHDTRVSQRALFR